MQDVIVKDLGLIDYMECWTLQQTFFDRLVAAKQKARDGVALCDKSRESTDDVNCPARQIVLLCEHAHVYTLGKSGKENNLLIDPAFLARIGATYYKVDRGGDITYHGPGQLVGYPILDLELLGIGLKEYVNRLEQAIINTIVHYGIKGERCEGVAGVWLPANGERPLRKIAAIGVRSSHFVTMHGFSLNVDPTMEYFSYINPCGFTDRGVTSIALETGAKIEMGEIKKAFTQEFRKVFELELVNNKL